MLVYSCQENYCAAIKLSTSEIELGKRGAYINEGKDVYEHILDYCKMHLGIK